VLSLRNLAVLAALTAAIVLAAILLRRSSAPTVPEAPAMTDDAVIELAGQTLLAEARQDAVRRCAPPDPPPTVILRVRLRTEANALEISSATPLAVDGGTLDGLGRCVSTVYLGRKYVAAKGPKSLPDGREYELDVRVVVGYLHFGN
jgi:hypothetical protein